MTNPLLPSVFTQDGAMPSVAKNRKILELDVEVYTSVCVCVPVGAGGGRHTVYAPVQYGLDVQIDAVYVLIQ